MIFPRSAVVLPPARVGGTTGGTEVLCARVKHTGVLSLSRGGRETRYPEKRATSTAQKSIPSARRTPYRTARGPRRHVLPSWLVHLSTTIDLTTSLRTLFRCIALAARHRTRSRETIVASPLCSVGAIGHTSHRTCGHHCDFLQNPGARRTR